MYFFFEPFSLQQQNKGDFQHDLIRTADTLFKLQNIQNNESLKKGWRDK